MVIVTMALTIHDIQHGLGRHMYYLSVDDITLVGLEYHVIEIFYVLSTGLIKVSACLFLLRIMARGTSKFLHWFLYIMMVLMMVLCAATGFVILFQCIPVQAGWDPRVKGKCLSYPSILGIGYAQNGECLVEPNLRSRLTIGSVVYHHRFRMCSFSNHHNPEIEHESSRQTGTVCHHEFGCAVR